MIDDRQRTPFLNEDLQVEFGQFMSMLRGGDEVLMYCIDLYLTRFQNHLHGNPCIPLMTEINKARLINAFPGKEIFGGSFLSKDSFPEGQNHPILLKGKRTAILIPMWPTHKEDKVQGSFLSIITCSRIGREKDRSTSTRR